MDDSASVTSLDEKRRERLSAALMRTGRGDRAAFEYLYKQTSAKLFGICIRIFADQSEAEDVLQDVYVTIWNRAATFQPGRASPISWLVAVARNRAIDKLRARGKAVFAPMEDAAEIADASPNAAETLLATAQEHRLTTCINGLDRRDAHFIRSAFFGGATYAQLADAEGAPLATVKSRIRRALIKLRQCMEDGG